MSFANLDADEFYHKLYTVVHPSQPIDTSEFLFGRDKQYSAMRTALYAPGRHCFIYGNRGVGKSSLAHSIAYDLQMQAEPILLSCDETTTMVSIVTDALREADARGMNKLEWTVSVSLGMAGTGVKFEKKSTSTIQEITINDTSSAVYALEYLQEIHSDKPFIIVDEFDRIEDPKERQKFGTLLKQIGDKKLDVKFIFTGIAESYQELLLGHASSSRQVHELKLEPLSYQGCFDIIERAFREFNLVVPDDIKIRIAGISDGYPHYVHLICEKMLGYAYENKIYSVTNDLFISGLDAAVTSVAEFLRRPYEMATTARDLNYTYILWAVADSRDLLRRKVDIKTSYDSVIEQVSWRNKQLFPNINDDQFMRILRNFKAQDYGEVVIPAFDGRRKGWYTFKENMLRGYIRMCAEANRIKLDFDKHFAAEPTALAKSSSKGRKTISQVEAEIEREERLSRISIEQHNKY